MNENFGEHYSSVWPAAEKSFEDTKVVLEKYKKWPTN